MFIQVIHGRVADADELHDSLDQWVRELGPGADGWLGSTGGVTDDGRFILVARFTSAETARRNSDRPEQHQWWMETSKLFEGGVTFHDFMKSTSGVGRAPTRPASSRSSRTRFGIPPRFANS